MGAVINGDIDGILYKLKTLNTPSKLNERLNRAIKKLAKYGLSRAEVYIQNAVYDGTPDYHVHLEWDSQTACRLVTHGDTVAFMEFGTGVTYPDDHEKAKEFGAERGEYGYKLGRLGTWRYPATKGAGTNGVPDNTHPGYIKTHGNPANKIMYQVGKDLHQRVREIVIKELNG